jgi:hypothetical protein
MLYDLEHRAHRHILSFASNLPTSLFFALRTIFLGSPEAKTSMSLAIPAALCKPLDTFLAIKITLSSGPTVS